MDPLRTIAESDGSFTRADALAVGYDDNGISRAVRARQWLRIRPGVLTFPDLWPPSPVDQHLVLAQAVARRFGPKVARSHVTAALHHGLSLFEPDLSLVHLTRLDGGAGRTESGVLHHEGFATATDLVEDRHGLLTNATRAAVEAASQGSAEAALVVFDDLLHLGKGTDETLTSTYSLLQSWPNTQHLHLPVLMADARAESPGESRSRWLFRTQNLPAPELQYGVHDENGRLIGTTDFAWPQYKLLGEFDGRIKYGRLLRDGETPGDAVFREKRREERLCERLGWRMIRLSWADLYSPVATAARIRRLMQLAA